MLTLAQLAEQLNGVWHGNANHAIFSFASLSRASSQDLAYFDTILLQDALKSTAAGAVLLKAEHQHLYQGNAIIVANPLQAMIQATSLLSIPHMAAPSIDPTAQIHSSSQIGAGVSIGAYTVIEEGVSIGPNSIIANHVVIHAGSQLGASTVVNSGCIIGASPFNYLKQHGVWQQGPVVGAVILADGVHLGANTVIDRGTVSDTYIATGVCIDNLVQIAHDVIIGKNTVIAGCSAIGAYAQIGADCIVGGASCIAAHAHLADDVVITGMSTVSKSLSKPGIYSSGTLVHEHQQWRRNAARFRRLDDYIMRLNSLEKKISSSEN